MVFSPLKLFHLYLLNSFSFIILCFKCYLCVSYPLSHPSNHLYGILWYLLCPKYSQREKKYNDATCFMKFSENPTWWSFSLLRRRTCGTLHISSSIMAHSEVSGLVWKLFQAEYVLYLFLIPCTMGYIIPHEMISLGISASHTPLANLTWVKCRWLLWTEHVFKSSAPKIVRHLAEVQYVMQCDYISFTYNYRKNICN